MLAAALALPGLGLPGPAAGAEADVLAGQGVVELRLLSYRDRQPGLERVRVDAPSLLLQTPLRGRWALEATATRDSVSGASPRWHSAVSGASRLRDNRAAFDARVTHHGDRHTWALGAATSDEHDFESRALSAEWRLRSEDGHRTVSVSGSVTRDRITSSDDPALDERRRTHSLGLGVTQVLSRVDVAQASLSWTEGRGHFSDPYKALDQRPDRRRQAALLLRWNHHVQGRELTLRSQWRAYRDSFGIRSHTLALEAVQGLGARWVVTPSLRYYTQSAASFYVDPVYSFLGEPYPPGWLDNPPRHLSLDHRLSAFGAVGLGLKLALQLDAAWTVDLKLEHYEQRGSWRLGGQGSSGLAPFKARAVQAGLVHRF